MAAFAKIAARWQEENFNYYCKSKYSGRGKATVRTTVRTDFYTKPADALRTGGISKTFDGSSIISKCACRAHTGKRVGCVVGLYIYKALSQQRVSVDTEIRSVVLDSLDVKPSANSNVPQKANYSV